MSRCGGRIRGDGRLQRFGSKLRAVRAKQKRPEVMQRGGMMRVMLEDFAIHVLGVGEAPGAMVIHCQSQRCVNVIARH